MRGRYTIVRGKERRTPVTPRAPASPRTAGQNKSGQKKEARRPRWPVRTSAELHRTAPLIALIAHWTTCTAIPSRSKTWGKTRECLTLRERAGERQRATYPDSHTQKTHALVSSDPKPQEPRRAPPPPSLAGALLYDDVVREGHAADRAAARGREGLLRLLVEQPQPLVAVDPSVVRTKNKHHVHVAPRLPAS